MYLLIYQLHHFCANSYFSFQSSISFDECFGLEVLRNKISDFKTFWTNVDEAFAKFG